MKKVTIILALVLCFTMVGVMLTACGSNEAGTGQTAAPTAGQSAEPTAAAQPAATEQPAKMTTVRLAVHSNEGSALTAIALEKGFFAENGIDVQLQVVASGPPEMAAMRADNRTLDIGYIGPGVAWNPIDPTGKQLSYVFFDFLGNSERLLARKGLFADSNNDGSFNLDEIYAGLKGQTIYMEVGTTPGVYFRSLVDTINEGKADAEKLWIQCDVEAYLKDYTAPNKDPANKVTVVNYNNSDIPAGMSTSDSSRVNLAVAFSPATTAVLTANADIIAVADHTILPPNNVSPGIWVASNDWINENPDTVQKVINALYEGAIYRTEHIDEAMRAGEKLCQKPANSFSAAIMKSISLQEYQDWFGKKDGNGWTLMNALYNNLKGKIPEGATPKSFEESSNFTFFLNAINNITSVPK